MKSPLTSSGIIEPQQTLRIAIVDDDRRVGQAMAAYLRSLNAQIRVYSDPAEFLAGLASTPVDIVIADLQMPVHSGLVVLKRVKARAPATDVVIMTGAADKQNAIEALKLGAFDFFEKPVVGAELVETIKRTVSYRELVRERDRLAEQVAYLSDRESQQWGLDGFIGEARAIKQCLKEIRLLQQAPDTSALILGESGTGKELVARAIHTGSSRSQRPFVPVNCSAIPAELAESTFFGHLRGSFTGAISDKKGCFDLAHEGTLFLDEIGDMPSPLQAKLLRVLEDSVVMPVGGTKAHTVNVRVVAATNADLAERIAAKSFRADLFYRLARFQILLPPLRERKSDIALLARHFVKKLAAEMGRATPALTPDATQILDAHTFPGNVRELKNVMERALIECGGEAIRAEHIHCVTLPGVPSPLPAAVLWPGAKSATFGSEPPLNLKNAEGSLIREAMARTNGNAAAAARLLGINRTKLYRKLAMLPT